jgi:subtilisin family serine protease
MQRHRITRVVRCAQAVLSATLLLCAAASADEPSDVKKEFRFAEQQQALFDRLNISEAWAITKGDPKVLVGVIDNGFDFFHPDLKGQLNPGFYYPGGYHSEFYEGIAHGTIDCSLIVARDNNPAGMVGLAPACRVLTASQGMLEHTLLKIQQKFFQDHPEASYADFQKEFIARAAELSKFGQDWALYQVSNAADAIRYLVDHGVKVINFSGGLRKGLCPSAEVWQKLEDAFTYAADKGVIIVVSAGNDATRCEDYPGNSDAVIVVGATRLDDTRWEQQVEFKRTKVKQGSSFGKRLTVMAPVEKLVVCVPHEQRFYSSDDGPMGATTVEFEGNHKILPIGATSSAAPIVTSLVALIHSIRPDLGAKVVVEIVKQGCDDIGDPGYDIYTGYGRVNFGKTLKLARDWETGVEHGKLQRARPRIESSLSSVGNFHNSRSSCVTRASSCATLLAIAHFAQHHALRNCSQLSFIVLNRSALPTTETELKLMAAAASIGFRRRCWEIGYSTPAAIGTPRAL